VETVLPASRTTAGPKPHRWALAVAKTAGSRGPSARYAQMTRATCCIKAVLEEVGDLDPSAATLIAGGNAQTVRLALARLEKRLAEEGSPDTSWCSTSLARRRGALHLPLAASRAELFDRASAAASQPRLAHRDSVAAERSAHEGLKPSTARAARARHRRARGPSSSPRRTDEYSAESDLLRGSFSPITLAGAVPRQLGRRRGDAVRGRHRGETFAARRGVQAASDVTCYATGRNRPEPLEARAPTEGPGEWLIFTGTERPVSLCRTRRAVVAPLTGNYSCGLRTDEGYARGTGARLRAIAEHRQHRDASGS